MATTIIIFSVQSRSAVSDVSLSVRSLSVKTVESRLNELFLPLKTSTVATRQFRLNHEIHDVFGEQEKVTKFMHSLAQQHRVSLFCGDSTYQNAFGINNLVPLLIDPEQGQVSTWTVNGSAPGDLSYLEIGLLNDQGVVAQTLLPNGLVTVDNVKTPYVDAMETLGLNITQYTKLERNQVDKDSFVSFVSGFYVGGTTFQFCWSSLAFGNDVSNFLSQNQEFSGSLMVIIERDGRIVASSDTKLVPNVLPNQDRYPLENSNDTDVSQAFTSFKQDYPLEQIHATVRHSHGLYFVDVVPYSGPEGTAGIDWLVVLMTPQEAILGAVTRSQNITLGVSIGILFVGLLLAYLTSFCITLPLFQIKDELKRVSQLKGLDSTQMRFTCRFSFLSEVRALTTATSKLKSGLQSFERYVPSSVVHSILRENRSAQLGMHNRVLTALFSDIESFTNITEQEEIGSLVLQLEEYFTLFNAKLREHCLALISYIGDAVFAFATEGENPGHALEAVRCALSVQNSLSLLNMQWKEEGKPELKTRIGVHTGEALVGNIGSFDRFSYTALGNTINLAARLESLNKTYGTNVLISDQTHSKVSEYVVCQTVDRVIVKGVTVPTNVYTPLGMRLNATEAINKVEKLTEKAFDLLSKKEFSICMETLEEASSVPGFESNTSLDTLKEKVLQIKAGKMTIVTEMTSK